MLVSFGQTPVSAASIIVDAVTPYAQNQAYWYEDAVSFGNMNIPERQRFYDYEVTQAAEQLGEAFPYPGTQISTAGNWNVALRNKIGYRVVEMRACWPGQSLDPVTRSCVKPGEPPIIEPPVVTLPRTFKPEPEPDEEAAIVPWKWIVGGLVVVFLVSRA